MKENSQKRIGQVKKSSDSISTDEEDQLYQTNTINFDTSSRLSFAVFFYNCKLFGLCSFNEHHNLNVDQYVFLPIIKALKKCFYGRWTKNNQGGIKMILLTRD